MDYQYNYHQFQNIPDASQSNEKALMWSHTQYMSESGYSTQAPSISSMDSYMDSQKTDTTATPSTTSTATANQPTAEASQEEDNAVANWINYQESSEMALKAIPDLLKLLIDEDLVVVQQAACLLHQMSKTEGPRQALIQFPNTVQYLVDCLNTTADFETARNLVGALFGISLQKGPGTQALINSKALPPLVKMLMAPLETIVHYSATTLHNVLISDCGEKVKLQLRKLGMIHQLLPHLNNTQHPKFLSVVVDSLHILAFGNQEAKQIMLEQGGTQMIVQLVNSLTNQYPKLTLNLIRLLKVLSVCAKNKQTLINLNVMQTLSLMLNNFKSGDVYHNLLVILRNLSDSATKINGLEQLVQNLLNVLSQVNAQPGSDSNNTVMTMISGILSNLTCNNENNKKAALRANGIQILFRVIQQNMAKPSLVDPCLCAVRHITNRYSDYLLAHEQVRSIQGIPLLCQIASIKPRAWGCIRALLGIIRNLLWNSSNAPQLKQNLVIEKLMQILYDAYTEINVRTNNGAQQASVVKVDDVNLLDIVDLSSGCLLVLAKEYSNQMIMKDLDCIGFFVQMFYSQLNQIQKSAGMILAELSANRDCAVVIDTQSGFHQFIQARFCNQFGQLKSIAEIGNAANSSHVSFVLQHVTTMMQRLQEHKQGVQRQASFPGFANQEQFQMYYGQQFSGASEFAQPQQQQGFY